MYGHDLWLAIRKSVFAAMNPLILLAEDDKNHREMLSALLREWGYEIMAVDNGRKAVDFCAKNPVDLVLMDVRMPKLDGVAAFREIHVLKPDLPVLVMTAWSDLPTAVETIRAGAADYLAKPLDFAHLKERLAKILAAPSAGTSVRAPVGEAVPGPGLLIGGSAAMHELADMIETVAPTQATVLISGESGVGKELVAKALHEKSGRNGRFVAVNCGAFTETLLASELFGHERGAFTGADKKREGLFAAARDGTIFLDEIGEMPPAMQVKLLRVLQEKEILPVGSSTPVAVNARVIAATNRDLSREVEEGRFREDLYYRLNVVLLTPPPLRERGAHDIALLAEHFAKRLAAANHKHFAGFDKAALARLAAWRWPGNVRELENVVERAIILMPSDTITEKQLPERLLEAGSASCGIDVRNGEIPTLDEVEREVILRTLERFGNNKSETAKALGITRKTLHSRLARYRGGE